MSGHYCEPCRKFLLGDLSVLTDNESSIEFIHHLDFESFDRAIQLPCLICTLVWANIEDSPSPSNTLWETVIGNYTYDHYDDQRYLRFSAVGGNAGKAWSPRLFLEPLSPTGLSICPTLSSSTSDALPFLLEQYHNCCANHARCNNLESLQSGQYPSRLLDVSTEGNLIVLRSTRMFQNQDYVCLSHCWGPSKPYTLNLTTKEDLELGIDATDLPKTFQDAIYVTRCLRIRYLWIDSLCILQDSETDWAIESGRMDQIYARAVCTIAATASSNSAGGLFFERNTEPLLPRVLDIHFDSGASWLTDKLEGFRLMGSYRCDKDHMLTHCIENTPLNSRAWVRQERQLSRRIMHFSDRQLVWECHKSTTCETYPDGVPRSAMSDWYDDSMMLKRCLYELRYQDEPLSKDSEIPSRLEPGLNKQLFSAWCSFRIKYSSSALTKENDKLVALRGIAKQVSRATGDELIAGLWKSRLVEELCWIKRSIGFVNPRPKLKEWRAPTWSWAASDNMIWISTLTRFHDGHKNRCFDAEIVDINVETKLSGELTHGSLRIKCRPMLAMIMPAIDKPLPRHENNGHVILIEDDMHSLNGKHAEKCLNVPSELMMDAPSFCKPQQAYLVAIQRCLHEDNYKRNEDGANESSQLALEGIQSQQMSLETKYSSEIDMMEGLLLQPNGKDSTTFSRIGVFHLEGSIAISAILNAHDKAEKRVITLI